MHLVHRRATLADVLGHESCIAESYFPGGAHRPEFRDFWKWLAAERRAISVVVENVSATGEVWPVAFSAYTFVSDEFVDHLKQGFIAGQLCGGRDAILNARQIAAANEAEGVNICVLHHAYPGHSLTELPATEIQEFMPPMLHQYTKGYRLKSYTKEAFGLQYRDWLTASGMRIRTDTNKGSFIIGITRDEVGQLTGARTSAMFLTAKPQFGFSDPIQEMLNLALTGRTDQELASELRLSLSAIKKRWAGIYGRVSEVAPGILGPKRDAMSCSRGGEHRRYLLAYLHAHPEEINFVPGSPRVRLLSRC